MAYHAWPDASEMQQWLTTNETAKTMVKRVRERCLPTIRPMPPLHQAPLHGRNVLEIAGPSGSGKSELLLQCAVSCILPKKWESLSLGGAEKPVLYLDLDCRFSMQRLLYVLECRINDAQWNLYEAACDIREGGGVQTTFTNTNSAHQHSVRMEVLGSRKDLIRTCLRRFYLKRCHNSFEFLAALKTIQSHLQRVAAEHGGSSAELLIVDSIGAFYWMQRSTRTTFGQAGRGTLGLQSVSGAVVNDLRQLLEIYPKLLIMATKTLILKRWETKSASFRKFGQFERNNFTKPGFRRLPMEIFQSDEYPSRGTALKGSTANPPHQEFMPASWRAFVTHRILIQGPYQSEKAPTDRLLCQSPSFFTAQWIHPFSAHVDFFVIQEDGIKLAI